MEGVVSADFNHAELPHKARRGSSSGPQTVTSWLKKVFYWSRLRGYHFSSITFFGRGLGLQIWWVKTQSDISSTQWVIKLRNCRVKGENSLYKYNLAAYRLSVFGKRFLLLDFFLCLLNAQEDWACPCQIRMWSQLGIIEKKLLMNSNVSKSRTNSVVIKDLI